MEDSNADGNKAYSAGDYNAAIECYTKAIESATSDKTNLSVLYSNRSGAYSRLEDYDNALKDADKVVELRPTWGQGYKMKGSVLVSLKRFEEALKTFSVGLLHEPHNELLQKGIEDADFELQKLATKKRKLLELTDDLDCTLCLKLLYEPVTTSCGHSFCRICLLRALDHSTACPLCRTVVYMSPDHPISVVLQNVIQKSFPEEYKERAKELEEDKTQDLMSLPIFLLGSVAFPDQSFPLHIFEPRYKTMIRRCLSGSRRFGLVCCSSSPQIEDVGCILEIKSVQMLPDGRSYVDTVGTSRFKIIDKWLQDGYMCGQVQLVSDEKTNIQEAEELVEEMRELITGMIEEAKADGANGQLKHIVRSLESMPGKEDPEKFSFWIASKLPLSTPQNVQLLRCTNTVERLKIEFDLIKKGKPSSSRMSSCPVQ